MLRRSGPFQRIAWGGVRLEGKSAAVPISFVLQEKWVPATFGSPVPKNAAAPGGSRNPAQESKEMAICPFPRNVLRVLLLGLLLAGCHRQPVRHLSSDVCLLLPGQTTRQEVLAFLGSPEQRRLDPIEGETWIYYQVKKSFFRKAPYLGGKMGEEHYDVVTVTFQGDLIRTCAYRSFDEEEFNKAGLAGREPSGS
jgi:hypothetical protein